MKRRDRIRAQRNKIKPTDVSLYKALTPRCEHCHKLGCNVVLGNCTNPDCKNPVRPYVWACQRSKPTLCSRCAREEEENS